MPQYIQAPPEIFDDGWRHLFVFAHQDDELFYSGIIGRLMRNSKFLWVTNGDGLAPQFREEPEKYAEKRIRETDEAMKFLGAQSDQMRCFGYSELEIYGKFVELTRQPHRKFEIMMYFFKIGCEIYREARDFRPDFVWTLAYQGGHPEHDLTHLLAAYATRQLSAETGKTAELMELPEYEFTLLIPMRFKPWKKGEAYFVRISDEKLARKKKMMEFYPSQFFIFRQFEKVIDSIGKAGKVFGKGFSFADFAGKETFATVPRDRDYTKSSHCSTIFDYMLERHKGTRICFGKTLKVLAEEIRGRRFV
ncbi:MAG: PIG-L family deacetylase [Deltaproteobacteria bacterium]|nr:PIG-L family deacetylase [Deltaproteobacteria bacterium]